MREEASRFKKFEVPLLSHTFGNGQIEQLIPTETA
jgi:hypothetical protein